MLIKLFIVHLNSFQVQSIVISQWVPATMKLCKSNYNSQSINKEFMKT